MEAERPQWKPRDFLNFQFFTVCAFADYDEEKHFLRIHGTISGIEGPVDVPCKFDLVLSAITSSATAGKRLSIQLSHRPLLDRQDSTTQQTSEVARLSLPERDDVGPWTVVYPLTYIPNSTGISTLQVVDLDGVFGPRRGILSSYKFNVVLVGNRTTEA